MRSRRVSHYHFRCWRSLHCTLCSSWQLVREKKKENRCMFREWWRTQKSFRWSFAQHIRLIRLSVDSAPKHDRDSVCGPLRHWEWQMQGAHKKCADILSLRLISVMPGDWPILSEQWKSERVRRTRNHSSNIVFWTTGEFNVVYLRFIDTLLQRDLHDVQRWTNEVYGIFSLHTKTAWQGWN